jgi:regulator of protease activity HflC (stomatin/prohibitin superfamily)
MTFVTSDAESSRSRQVTGIAGHELSSAKETQEAQRSEAAGVRDFQQIVAQGITPSLLEWKGIEATENLAKSPNSKVVVIGNNKNGLPLILGQ